MNRYINAGNLLTKIKAYRPYQYLGEDALSYAIKMVELEPSADVRENVRGGWIRHDGRCINGDYYPTRYECNQCHHFVGVATDKNFCPNCGAQMMRGDKT